MPIKLSACALLLVLGCAAFTGDSAPVPRERILADLVKRADDTYRKAGRPNASYGCRELFTAMLAYAAAGTNLTRVAELLTVAEQMQNRDPDHKAFGNFRWYARDAEVMDFNAVDFCMQHGALLWRFHREALDPATRERLRVMLRRGLTGLVNHRPSTTYTNIALLNASDLILLGEVLGDAQAVAEGERRLDLFIKTLWEEGTHEYVSPTYYGVDVESMMLLETLSEKAATRSLAETLLRFFWTDIALNWFDPSQRLAGAHSRTYDYVYGFGELDQILSACGWLPLAGKFGFTTFTPLYARWQPSPELRELGTAAYPRLVEQTWGAEPFCSRTHYVCRDVTLGTAWKAYHGRMDITLSADLPGTREERLPRMSFIPDGRGDPYGKLRVFDGKTHSKAFHLSPWWAAVQDREDALGVAVYRDADFKDATGTLESHLLFSKKLDGLWINETRVAFDGKTNSVIGVPRDAAVFLRQGTAVIGIRVPWTRGQDGAASPVSLVDDRNAFGAARLTVSHAWLSPSNASSRVCAGAAFWLRIGSGIENGDAFSAFRKDFVAAAAEARILPDGLSLQVAGIRQPLRITAKAPFDRDPVTSPAPPRTVLGLDGKDLGRQILEQSPVIRAYLKTRRPSARIIVAPGHPTVWEAEQGSFTVPFEAATHDDAASGGAYLWVPETDGRSGGGSGGRATYTLHVAAAGRHTLSGRVLTPTPEDDSFFVSIRSEAGEMLFPETVWSPGVFKTWTWRDIPLSNQRGSVAFDLPQGDVTLTLRPREAGSRIDQFRITPLDP
ncbi:MAG TPA: hypothetical protein PKM57_10520 [Kiritimatiellia bacterium]|nr:hypothetical protein [Kiritimatiellia bacterium]HPS06607.1 hypothetical protein [Kiritimatiellia bacterium]